MIPEINSPDEVNFHTIIRMAYEKGARVTEEGKLIGVSGKELGVKRRGSQRYPTFSFKCGNEFTKSGVYGIPVHKLAAYCFYGESMFREGVVVRHLDADVLNVSRENIVLGTSSDNERDKCPKDRSRVARIARAAQGKRPSNARFSDDDVRSIRARSELGESGASIGRSLGTTKECIHLILKGVNYKDVI